jgi:hypothetical protein
MAARQLSDGHDDGTVLGKGATDKVGFYGATAVAKPLASTAGALTAGETSATAVAAAFVDLRTQLVNLGLIRLT